ncbi:MAG: NAD-dependent epimerase/dehydratase family protein [Proteobacteria bacterium]|nr:NAD-dependent epimerase/dehydratase family protein [Pseudomonadota bacterium]
MINSEQAVAARPWLILGCGYTGIRLARRLLDRGAEVWATRRSPDAVQSVATALGNHPKADVRVVSVEELAGAAETVADWIPRGSLLVHSAPPSQSGPMGERAVVAACAASGVSRIVYISSTGVYPPGDGSWVDEDAAVGPASDRGKARLAAESALLQAARERDIPAVSLRAAGIYGPGRGVHARLYAGTFRVIGAGDTYVNRIHVDDLVSSVVAAALISELPRAIYNVADDRPETSRVHANSVADILGLPRPPAVPASEVHPRVAAMLGANRRIRNDRLKSELGVRLAYPTWREGLAQVMVEDGIAAAKKSAEAARRSEER